MEIRQIVTFEAEDTFLSLNVHRTAGDLCGGICNELNTIYIPHPEGPTKYKHINDNHIFIAEQRSKNYWALKPMNQPVGVAGPFAGGHLAYSSDSRCTEIYHIHDRFETWEAYKHLST